MNVLLVEDEAPKLEKLREFFDENYQQARLTVAKSVRGAVDCLRVGEDFKLVVLDMSLPTFDIAAGESGGAPQGFGGIEIMRFMDRYALSIPVVVVTAYEAFDEGKRTWGLDDLRKSLVDDYPENFRSLVYYNIVFGTWVAELKVAIDNVLKEGLQE